MQHEDFLGGWSKTPFCLHYFLDHFFYLTNNMILQRKMDQGILSLQAAYTLVQDFSLG
jgi:hypothetical protein